MNEFFHFARLTFRDPPTAWKILSARIPDATGRLALLALTAAIAAILASLVGMVVEPDPAVPETFFDRVSPLGLFGMQFGGQLVTAAVIAIGGRMFGGRGTVMDMVLALSWIGVLGLLAQILQIMFAFISPGIGIILGLAVLIFGLWLTVAFTRAVHGFRSTALTAFGMLGGLLIVALFLSFLLTSLGVTVV